MMPTVTVRSADRIGEQYKADVFCTSAELVSMAKEAKSITEKFNAARLSRKAPAPWSSATEIAGYI